MGITRRHRAGRCNRDCNILLITLLTSLVLTIISVTAYTQSSVSLTQPQDMLYAASDNNLGNRMLLVNVPAVTGEQGKLIRIVIKTTDRPGVIFTGPVEVGEDTFASAWTAYLVASLLAGVSPFEKGIEITMLTDSNNVEGPSASLAIAIATYVLEKNRYPPIALENYSITGAISLDGASVIVGGIYKKLEATLASGLEGMVIPASNGFVFEGDRLDSENYVPVYGVLDGLDKLYNKNPVVLPIVTTYPPPLKEFLKEIGKAFSEKASDMSSLIEDPKAFSRVSYYLNESEKALKQGKLYTYASLAYSAYLASITAFYEKASPEELSRLYNDTLSRLEKIKEKIKFQESLLYSKREIGQYVLEILAIAESRTWMCESLLREFLNNELDFETRKNSLIQAAARCETASTWIKALELNWEQQPTVKLNLLEEAIDEYQVFLEHSMTYVASAVEMDVVPPSIKVYFQELEDLAKRIKESARKGNPGLRLGLSVELASRLSSFLTQMNSIHMESLSGYVAELWRNLEILNGHLASYGRTSLMASLYAEYAQYEEHGFPTQIALLDTAISSIQPFLLYSFLEDNGSGSGSMEEMMDLIERLSVTEMYKSWLVLGTISTLIGIIMFRLQSGRVD